VAVSTEVVVAHDPCPAALLDAGRFLAQYAHAAPLPAAAVAKAAEVMPALLACEALGPNRPVLDSAAERLAAMRTRLGIERPCGHDRDCGGGALPGRPRLSAGAAEHRPDVAAAVARARGHRCSRRAGDGQGSGVQQQRVPMNAAPR